MNKKVLVILIILLIGSLFITKPVFAAWTQAKGHAYNQLTYSYYITDHKYTTVSTLSDKVHSTGEQNTRVRTSKFQSQALTYYGEYGINDTLTVFIAVPYKWIDSDDIQKYENKKGPSGIGDIDFGLRYNLLKNLFGSGVLMSVQGAVKIPEAYKYGDPMEALSLGDGQYDTTLALMFGRGFPKGYAHLLVGYIYRFENKEFYPFTPSDKIKVTLGGGYPITSWFSIRGLVDYSHSVGNAVVSQLMIDHARFTGQTLQKSQDNTLIRDTLALEASTLNVGGSLVFNIKPKIQAVLSYSADIEGVEDWGIKTMDSGVGETYSLALVYMW